MKKGTIASGFTMASKVISGLTRSMAGLGINARPPVCRGDALGGCPSASSGDVEEAAGDVARLLAQQPQDALGHFLRTAGALHRHGGGKLECAVGHAARG